MIHLTSLNRKRLCLGAFGLMAMALIAPTVSQGQVAQPTGVTDIDRGRLSSSVNEEAKGARARVISPTGTLEARSSRVLRSLPAAHDRAEFSRSTRVALISAGVVAAAVVAYWLFLSLDRHS